MDYSKIEKKIHELLNKFGIEIEKSDYETRSNNPEMLYFHFNPTSSTEILKILKFQYFIRKNSRDDLFGFKNYYGLTFNINTNKAEQLFKYLNQLSIPNNLNEIFPGSDLEDFLRDFSKDELSSMVGYYPERARDFMAFEYSRLFKETVLNLLDERVRLKIFSTPLRYYIWKDFINTGTWHLYLEELSYGHSEDWARLVASGNLCRSLDKRYAEAFGTLRHKNWNSAMRNACINIHRRFENESEAFANKYFDFLTTGWSNPLALTQSYMSVYNACIDTGKSHAFADKFAKGMTSGFRAGDESYWIEKAERQSQISK